VRWLVGRAEDVEAPPGSFELITIGEAFHRLDRWTVAQRAFDWLAPGRCLATMGVSGVWAGPEPWQALVAAVMRRWRDDALAWRPDHPDEAVLRAAGFADVEKHDFEVPYIWSLDAIVGNLYSTSVASRHALGDRADAFEADLRRTLLAHDPRGEYPATLSFGYTLARRPAS
jgi:hypothetical protein